MEDSEFTARLRGLRDETYAALQRKVVPTVAPESVIGVRVPALRALAREWAGTPEAEAFLDRLPHGYYDENQLHAYLLSREKDFSKCLARVEAFLPFVDNWATCDSLSPTVFRKHRRELPPVIRRWTESDRPYTVRFGVGMLMSHYLNEDFDPEYLAWAAAIQSEEYYVNMMIAWYFATALAKQYDAALPYLTERKLPVWVHNKTIQKAVESYRITPEQKAYLKTLRIRGR